MSARFQRVAKWTHVSPKGRDRNRSRNVDTSWSIGEPTWCAPRNSTACRIPSPESFPPFARAGRLRPVVARPLSADGAVLGRFRRFRHASVTNCRDLTSTGIGSTRRHDLRRSVTAISTPTSVDPARFRLARRAMRRGGRRSSDRAGARRSSPEPAASGAPASLPLRARRNGSRVRAVAVRFRRS